jgi:GNAT superfamily N-acetyltransferase
LATSTVRPATLADAAAAASCQAAAFRLAYANILPAERLRSPALDDELLEKRRARYAEQPGVQLVLEAPLEPGGGHAVLAFCDAGPLRPYPGLRPQVAQPEAAGATLELWALYAHPQLRGQGAGQKLFGATAAAALRRFPECRQRLIVLTFEGNAPARRLYERLGGQLFGVLDGYELWERVYRVACYEWVPASAAVPAR